jgi:hypothetical protein
MIIKDKKLEAKTLRTQRNTLLSATAERPILDRISPEKYLTRLLLGGWVACPIVVRLSHRADATNTKETVRLFQKSTLYKTEFVLVHKLTPVDLCLKNVRFC